MVGKKLIEVEKAAKEAVKGRTSAEEAIKALEYYMGLMYMGTPCAADEFALERAIVALQEVQRYEAIGTVEECKKAVEKCKKQEGQSAKVKKYCDM